MSLSRRVVRTNYIEYLNKEGGWHREDGPAVEYTSELRRGDKYWYFENELHRVDGPAVEHRDGRNDYFLFDTYYGTKEEWEAELVKLGLEVPGSGKPVELEL